MQSKISILKKIIGKYMLLINSYYPIETEMGKIKNVIDEETVLFVTSREIEKEVSIFDLRNPEHEI